MTPYYEEGGITIYHGDCRDVLPTLENGSVDLLLTDPPYFEIAGASWDFQWRTVSDWADWCLTWARDACRALKENGSAYIFGDEKNIAYMQVRLDTLDWGLLNHIVWSKTNYTMLKASPEAMRSFRPQGEEHILFYGRDIRTFADTVVPLSAAPMATYIKAERERAGLTRRQVAAFFPSKTGGLTGCVTNWEEGYNFPTAEIYARLRDVLNTHGRQEYSYLRQEYSYLRQEYETLRRPFSGGQYTDVWSGPASSSTHKQHICEKPPWILRRIMQASAVPGALVVDPFMGAGSTLRAAKDLGMCAIGVDTDERNCDLAARKLQQEVFAL